MPLPRTTAAAVYARSFSKAAPASPSSLRATPDITASSSLASLRRPKYAPEIPPKSPKVQAWAPMSPRASYELPADDDKAFREAQECVPSDASTLMRSTKPDDDRVPMTLADMGIIKKPRRKGKDSDFEFIPAPRSVIVLDDNLTPEPDFDEPWEHIYGVDDDTTLHRLSYAKIASL